MALRQLLQTDLKQVQNIIKKEISPDQKTIVREKSIELFESGGKKIRPSFTILAGKLGSEMYHEDVLKVAASLELIHMASLVHDDVIDNSKLRRGKHTVYHDSGYTQAILTGNYLFSCALNLISEISSKRFHELYATTIESIVKGELEQFEHQFNANISLESYYQKTYRKTALLIETSVKLGAYAAHLSDEITERLTEYAYHIGMSFQIIDDCLDFIGNEKFLGKPKYSDLINGHFTLPVILLRDTDDEFKQLLKLYAEDKIDSDIIITRILNSNALDRALKKAKEHNSLAIKALDTLDHNLKQAFIDVAIKLENRIS